MGHVFTPVSITNATIATKCEGAVLHGLATATWRRAGFAERSSAVDSDNSGEKGHKKNSAERRSLGSRTTQSTAPLTDFGHLIFSTV
jgi:hypothetical protein